MEKETLVKLLELLVLAGHLTEEDVMPLIKKGIAKMLNEPEDKIFKQEKELNPF